MNKVPVYKTVDCEMSIRNINTKKKAVELFAVKKCQYSCVLV